MLVIWLGTVDQQLSVAWTRLRNTARADPKMLLWRKPLNTIKGLPFVTKFLIKKYVGVSIVKGTSKIFIVHLLEEM